MPIYEYRCENGHAFEVMRRISDAPLAECQVCGASVERVFRPPAVHFKGSGFYNTDYGTRKRAREQRDSGDSAKTAESKGGSESASSSAGEKKTPAKDAA